MDSSLYNQTAKSILIVCVYVALLYICVASIFFFLTMWAMASNRYSIFNSVCRETIKNDIIIEHDNQLVKKKKITSVKSRRVITKIN